MKVKSITTITLVLVLTVSVFSTSFRIDDVIAFAPKHCATSDDGITSCSGGSGNGEGGSGGHCTTSSTGSVCSSGQGSSPSSIDGEGGFGEHSICDFATGCSAVGGSGYK